jgi:nitroreductase/ferredoxin
MINLDADRCVKCGACADVCPAGVFNFATGSTPVVVEERKARCISCGHCGAVCPQGAVTVSGPLLDDVGTHRVDPYINAEMMRNYFLRRRSVRRYKKDAVPRQWLENVLDIVRYAPSAVNNQPVRWVIVYDTVKLQEIAAKVVEWMKGAIASEHPLAETLGFRGLVIGWKKGLDPICRHAPHVIVAYGAKDDRRAPTDATIALAHLEILAPAHGIGACWAGYFQVAASQSAEVRQALGIPEGNVPLGSMLVGIPRYEYKRVPRRNKLSATWI